METHTIIILKKENFKKFKNKKKLDQEIKKIKEIAKSTFKDYKKNDDLKFIKSAVGCYGYIAQIVNLEFYKKYKDNFKNYEKIGEK